MLTGIVVSTQMEINVISGMLHDYERFEIHRKTFYRGVINNITPVIICICGVGKTNASHGTTLLIENFSPDSIYIIGIGGAYPSSGLNIGDIAIAEKEIYGDEGLALQNSFCTMEEIGLPILKIGDIHYYNEFQTFIPEPLRKFKNIGNFITVSSCTGSLEKALAIEKRFDAICENMEGAAVAHICKLYGITPVEIRGISNLIRERKAERLNKEDIVRASERVQRFFLDIIG